jgi:hypothetical protein
MDTALHDAVFYQLFASDPDTGDVSCLLSVANAPELMDNVVAALRPFFERPQATCMTQAPFAPPPDHIADASKMVASVTEEEVMELFHRHSFVAAASGYRTVLFNDAATALLPLFAREHQTGRREGIEEAAKMATSFLVGDPRNGVPFRNPMAHEIAAAIRALIGKEAGDA